MKQIVFFTYDGGQLLDMSGPAAVFAEANEFIARPAYEIVMVSPQGGLVRARGNIALETRPFAGMSSRGIDTLIVSGGMGPPLLDMLRNEAAATWFRSAAKHARRVGSTCTGAFVLAAWGLLDGRRATTHWQAVDRLRALHPSVEVDGDALFVEHRGVWTSAGVSTGIDMALAMVERDHDRALASAVARRLVLQMRRPGSQSQFSSVLAAQGGPYAELLQWMGNNLDADLAVEALAARAHQTPRTFSRRFAAEVGMPPAAYVERLRLDRARALLDAGRPAKSVAIEAGFGSLNRLWRAFRRVYSLNPSTYRAIHGPARHLARG
ncbi:MAG: helix-turn-helix domain-containing protein [Burkholderiales bacterium]|nr:helix-turn-helix domain-containing protein [Burkholderiales bacterium]